ncbi:MAG TPA: sensor histidine kinase, partial [Rheinheimera sp.]|nr:sensor histidine kinase [Rheinheimera sp.]
MSELGLRQILRLNICYWLIILGLGLLADWQMTFIHQKPFGWSYLPMLLLNQFVAMLLTAGLVVWSYRRIEKQSFSSWQLLLGVMVVAAIYIPADNALWMLLWDEKIIDVRMLIGNLDTSVLAFFVWAACYLTILVYRQQLARAAETSRLNQKIQQL